MSVTHNIQTAKLFWNELELLIDLALYTRAQQNIRAMGLIQNCKLDLYYHTAGNFRVWVSFLT